MFLLKIANRVRMNKVSRGGGGGACGSSLVWQKGELCKCNNSQI
jgi:hypothetical protein